MSRKPTMGSIPGGRLARTRLMPTVRLTSTSETCEMNNLSEKSSRTQRGQKFSSRKNATGHKNPRQETQIPAGNYSNNPSQGTMREYSGVRQ